MSHPEGILDTSVVIDLPRVDDPRQLPDTPLITAITLAELSVGPLVTDDLEERLKRQLILQKAESSFEPLAFDSSAARAFGGIAAQLRMAGSKRRARAYDALIAAIAVSRGLPVYTKNPGDFADIANLEVVAVAGETH